MRKIYDCFTYNNEDLLLSLRLETLNEVVDKFVIAEAPYAHSGTPKPLYYNPSRFKKFAHKIIHLVVDDMPIGLGDALANEIHQRNALLRGLTQATRHDWVIISDVDEIPRPEAIRRYRPWNLYGTFVQRFYNYFLNNLAVQEHASLKPRWWIRSKITTIAHLNNFFRTPQNLRIYKPESGLSGTLQQLHRRLRHQRLHEGGWHFSWVMTPEQMIQKVESYSHTEHNIPTIKSIDAIRSAIQNGRDILGKDEHFRLVKIDDRFPRHLVQNFDQYREWYLDPEMGPASH